MGWDAVHPFVTQSYSGRGAFILCKTSNPSSSVWLNFILSLFYYGLMFFKSKEMQLVITQNGQNYYETVLDRCIQWQSLAPDSLIGIVAGATDIDALRNIRNKAPDMWILCPGVGAQGGEARDVCAAALRQDGSGLLISVSRGISKASDMAQAARELRDQISILRSIKQQQGQVESESASDKNAGDLKPFQRQFINFALEQSALQFGSFTLKSGRRSPYFFNAGKLCSGQSISILGRAYAQAVRDSSLEFDVIFGPAYKGIPLATAFAMAWFELFGESKDVTYNRKEAKDHGEGGLLVGATISGRRVLIIDDVITAGTAIREAVTFLQEAGAVLVGAIVSFDRQERTGSSDGVSSLSAIQQVEQEYKFPVIAIVRLQELINFVLESSSGDGKRENVEAMQQYRSLYGVV